MVPAQTMLAQTVPEVPAQTVAEGPVASKVDEDSRPPPKLPASSAVMHEADLDAKSAKRSVEIVAVRSRDDDEDNVDFTNEELPAHHPKDSPTQEYKQIQKHVRAMYHLQQEKWKENVSEETFELCQKVRRLEEDFVFSLCASAQQQQREFAKLKWSSKRQEQTNVKKRGADQDMYDARRQDGQEIAQSQPFMDAALRKRVLYEDHRNALLELFLFGCVPPEIKLSPFSMHALASSDGSQPSRYPEACDYGSLMHNLGLVCWPPGSGRMPGKPAGDSEPKLTAEELKSSFDHAGHWMSLGNFDNASQLDAHGFSALHHACDHSSWSLRAALAAIQLIALTPPEIINHFTTCEQRGWPDGYQCLHLAANGSARNTVRQKLVMSLIDARADINAKTKNAKANTAAGLASGQGATDVGLLILELGGDKDAQNATGKGYVEMARACSSTTLKALQGVEVPDTNANRSGRSRTTRGSTSRQDRYARGESNWTSSGSQPSNQRDWQSLSSSSSWNHAAADASWAHDASWAEPPFLFQQPARSWYHSTSWSGRR